MDSSFSYAIDAEDRLISVGSTWDHFAQDNGATNLSGDKIVGRQVWAFFAYPGVRESQQSLEVPFRCDSPTQRRYIQGEHLPRMSHGICRPCKAGALAGLN